MTFEPKKIKLSKPIEHGNEEITELCINREPVAGDLRGIPVRDMTYDHLYEITSRLTGVPSPAIRKLSLKDFVEISAMVTSFLYDSQ